MNLEKDYIYEIETEVSDLNENNILKPYAYQKIFAKIAERHLSRLNLNVDTTLKYNLSWVLVSLSIEMVKPIEGCIKIFANTWYSKRRGPYFRREFVLKNEEGEVITKGSTFSILLDTQKRAIYTKKEIPFILSEPIEEFTIEAGPTFKTNLEFSKIEERRVYNSYIDRNGHVNNCRYGEFVYDVFTDEEREDLIKLKRMDIYFLSELRNKDTFTILQAYEGTKMFVRGYNNTKANNAFDIILGF